MLRTDAGFRLPEDNFINQDYCLFFGVETKNTESSI